ncbi:MAG: hypothetical protein V1735_04500 [Nanoarchaeota archaeon]
MNKDQFERINQEYKEINTFIPKQNSKDTLKREEKIKLFLTIHNQNNLNKATMRLVWCTVLLAAIGLLGILREIFGIGWTRNTLAIIARIIIYLLIAEAIVQLIKDQIEIYHDKRKRKDHLVYIIGEWIVNTWNRVFKKRGTASAIFILKSVLILILGGIIISAIAETHPTKEVKSINESYQDSSNNLISWIQIGDDLGSILKAIAATAVIAGFTYLLLKKETER